MNIKGLLRQVPATAYLYAALGAAVVAGYAGFVHQQRDIGRRDVLTAQANASRDSLAKLIRHKDAQFARDTVRVFRSVATVDTLIQRWIDTALVQRTDTVTLTVHEATAIQDTLRACRSLVRDCISLQRDLRGMLRADSQIIRTLRAGQSHALTPWRHRLEGGLVVLGVLKLTGVVR